MVVNVIKYDSDLMIKVQTGTGASGDPIYKLRRYTRVNPGATHESVRAVGKAIVGLQAHAVIEIIRQDDIRL